MLAKAADAKGVDLGEHVIVGGLFVQVVFFGFFVAVAGIFHCGISVWPTAE